MAYDNSRDFDAAARKRMEFVATAPNPKWDAEIDERAARKIASNRRYVAIRLAGENNIAAAFEQVVSEGLPDPDDAYNWDDGESLDALLNAARIYDWD